MADPIERLERIRKVLEFKRNVVIQDDERFVDKWIAIPDDDFVAARAALTDLDALEAQLAQVAEPTEEMVDLFEWSDAVEKGLLLPRESSELYAGYGDLETFVTKVKALRAALAAAVHQDGAVYEAVNAARPDTDAWGQHRWSKDTTGGYHWCEKCGEYQNVVGSICRGKKSCVRCGSTKWAWYNRGTGRCEQCAEPGTQFGEPARPDAAQGSVSGGRKCPNCQQLLKQGEAGHFAPPSLGEPGFYICRPTGGERE